MGADFIFDICAVPGVSGDEFEAECKKFVDGLSKEAVWDYLENIQGGFMNTPGASDEENLAYAKKEMLESLVEAEKALQGNRRDLTVLTLNGADYFLTGGMSWGDDPTDAYQYVHRLAYSGVDILGLANNVRADSENEFRLEKDNMWVTVGSISVCIRKTDEGAVVDMYRKGEEDLDKAQLASCYAFFAEAEVFYNCRNCGCRAFPHSDAHFAVDGRVLCPECDSTEVEKEG